MKCDTCSPRLPFDVVTDLTESARLLYAARLHAHEAGLHDLAASIAELYRQLDGLIP